jgi:hypothetical protein
MTSRVFTRDDAWSGGSYDLAIELGPRDDARLTRALEALWSCTDLDGCYEFADREPHEQLRVNVGAFSLETPLHGIARIGSRAQIACRTVVVRFDDGADWIYVSLPLGSLGHIFEVGAFPFEDGGDLSWRPALDEWLCGLGRRAFNAVPFRLALVGWDGGELDDAETFHTSGVPAERWVGYLVAEAESLRWFPPNRDAPLTINRT